MPALSDLIRAWLSINHLDDLWYVDGNWLTHTQKHSAKGIYLIKIKHDHVIVLAVNGLVALKLFAADSQFFDKLHDAIIKLEHDEFS